MKVASQKWTKMKARAQKRLTAMSQRAHLSTNQATKSDSGIRGTNHTLSS